MSILALTSDTLAGTPAAGQIEYTSPIFAATPINTQRGIIPTQQYYRLDSSLAGANSTSAQNIFGVGVTLSSGTVYEFEMNVVFTKSAGTTSHTLGFGFAGTATLNNILYLGIGNAFLSSTSGPAYGVTTYGVYATTASNTASNMQTVSAAASWSIVIKGTVSVNAGGTFIPQYTLTAAPGGAYTVYAGSFVRIAPIGASGAATNVGTWA
jgi:hypothetical protein